MKPHKTIHYNLTITHRVVIFILGLSLIMLYIMWCVSKPIEQFSSDISINKHDAFCKTNVGNSTTLNGKCGQLTSDNCKSTSCCVWTSDQKCLAGGSDGPTFNNLNGKTKKLDYYYFDNKCYGDKCP